MMIATLLLSSVTVTLSGDVVVGGTEISLGDVAQVSGEDAALVARPHPSLRLRAAWSWGARSGSPWRAWCAWPPSATDPWAFWTASYV